MVRLFVFAMYGPVGIPFLRRKTTTKGTVRYCLGRADIMHKACAKCVSFVREKCNVHGVASKQLRFSMFSVGMDVVFVVDN